MNMKNSDYSRGYYAALRTRERQKQRKSVYRRNFWAYFFGDLYLIFVVAAYIFITFYLFEYYGAWGFSTLALAIFAGIGVHADKKASKAREAHDALQKKIDEDDRLA